MEQRPRVPGGGGALPAGEDAGDDLVAPPRPGDLPAPVRAALVDHLGAVRGVKARQGLRVPGVDRPLLPRELGLHLFQRRHRDRHEASTPPSTWMVLPVTKPAMSLAANTAARAMSSAWASRPSAILAIVSSSSRLAWSASAPLNRAGAAR